MSGFLSAGIVGGPDIPDSEIYLQDDFGDNKLQNRDDSDTTTYNGVEGVYRPEYIIQSGNPQAANEQLELVDRASLYSDINLALDEVITWEFKGVDVTESSNSNNIFGIGLWSDGTTVDAGRPLDGYYVEIRPSNKISLFEQNGDAELITGPEPSQDDDITVIRDPTVSGDPEFELVVNGSSEGTAQSANDPSSIDYWVIGRRKDESGVAYSIDEAKVF